MLCWQATLDHPRVCGEQFSCSGIGNAYRGSPPRVRGTGRRLKTLPRGIRITPACAGNRPFAYGETVQVEDHPRVCGEQPKDAAAEIVRSGSPPRVRGTGADSVANVLVDGITPACAGNSRLPRLGRRASKDHPRVCGEQGHRQVFPLGQLGSPPRVRGTADKFTSISPEPWITPACAGNRLSRRSYRMRSRDHPRVCGEQLNRAALNVIFIGSPPRVRGTVDKNSSWRIWYRITPACAGNRGALEGKEPDRQDHPRVCGEQMRTANGLRGSIGSPPRVRGTVGARLQPLPGNRITPACAGNRLKKARHFYILFCQIKRIHLV